MKRIYENGDAVFNLTLNKYPFDVENIKSVVFTFYTNNPNDNIIKTQEDVIDGVLVIKWDQLKLLSEGVLFYDYLLDDGKIVKSLQNTSDYYIVTSKDIEVHRDGITFIPNVSEDGIISWTNEEGATNPEPVDIRGPLGVKGDKGDKGDQGIQGIQGEKGETPVAFEIGEDGHLYLLTDNEALAERFSIDSNGDLIYEINE